MKDDFTVAFDYVINGPPTGPPLVFIHGWPDDASLWRKQVAALQGRYRCVCLTLPNFGPEHPIPAGLDFPALVSMLETTLDEVAPGPAPVILVTHDWGAYLGYLLEQARPERIGRMIALDIGGHIAPAGLKEAAMIAGYQWALILFWLIGRVNASAGDRLTRWFAARLGVPARQAALARARFNYPYFYLWRGLLLPWRGSLLRQYRPRCPVLYMWGRKKPVMFHSPRWLEIVRQTGGCCEGIDDAGHWFMETHPAETNDRILRWLENNPGPARGAPGSGPNGRGKGQDAMGKDIQVTSR